MEHFSHFQNCFCYMEKHVQSTAWFEKADSIKQQADSLRLAGDESEMWDWEYGNYGWTNNVTSQPLKSCAFETMLLLTLTLQRENHAKVAEGQYSQLGLLCQSQQPALIELDHPPHLQQLQQDLQTGQKEARDVRTSSETKRTTVGEVCWGWGGV